MHILIGFGIIVGLVIFAFGPRAAQVLVQVTAFCAVTFFAWAVWDIENENRHPTRTEMQVQHLGRRGDVTPAHATISSIAVAQFDPTKDFEVALVRKCMAHYDFDRDHQSQCVAVATKEFYAFKQAEQVSR